jgi:hypothetical protein
MNTILSKRTSVWVIASIAVILLISSFVMATLGMVAIGFAGAINQCGIKVFAASPQYAPTPVPDITVQTVASKSASEAYFDQFSASQQAEMKKNAALIVSIGENRPEKLTTHDIEAAVGVAIQESHITNLTVAVDHDSLGIYQQRPSAGSWGTAAQILDPVHAINKFYDAMVRIPSAQRQSMKLIDIGIAVQIPNRAAYQRTWAWDTIASEIVSTYTNGGASQNGDGNGLSGDICTESAGVSVSSSNWQLPLASGSYCVLDGYGMRINPYSKVRKMHNGTDLACNDGDPIYAATSGTIEMAKPYGGYGNFVKINHANNISTGYGHMSRIADGITKGTEVSTGQLIGYVGSTGGSTGPHLHFEVTVDGQFTDPVPFMEQQGVKIE